MMNKKNLPFSILLLLLSAACAATVKLPAVFGNGMVLQQQSNVAFWGWANKGEQVTIKAPWLTAPVIVQTPENGQWKTFIKTPKAGGPFTIEIRGTNFIQLKDVLIGEVWLCSGQSNMAFMLKNTENAKAEIARSSFPKIRFLTTPRQYGNCPFDDATGSVWEKASPTTTPALSAVAYYFAKKIHADLNVPVGIIVSAWGGTPAEAWTPDYLITKDPVLQVYTDRWNKIQNNYVQDSIQYYKKLKTWEQSGSKGDSSNNKKPGIPQSVYYYNRPFRKPSVLFNGMINPLVPYTIKGAIWYQGESNVAYASEYYHLLTSLIKSWRREWNYDFPFYIVQLAPFKYSNLENAAVLRDAQYKIAKTLVNTGVAATADIGNMRNAHPKQKRQVGERLALIALHKDYGKKQLQYLGPEVKDIKVQGKYVQLTFTQSLLLKAGKVPTGFELGYKEPGFDKLMYKTASSKVENNKVIVWSDSVKAPLAVRYAFVLAAHGNLMNSQGLPAYPFSKAITRQ